MSKENKKYPGLGLIIMILIVAVIVLGSGFYNDSPDRKLAIEPSNHADYEAGACVQCHTGGIGGATIAPIVTEKDLELDHSGFDSLQQCIDCHAGGAGGPDIEGHPVQDDYCLDCHVSE